MFYVFIEELFKQCAFFSIEHDRIDTSLCPCQIYHLSYLEMHIV